MLALTLQSPQRPRLEVLCVGAHCDDIEIGCGGAVLSLQREGRACRFHWLVLSSVPQRRDEASAAFEAMVMPQNRGELRVFGLRDGLLPSHFAELKSYFEQMKSDVEPDLIFTHHGADRHQDHAIVSQVTWQTFRDHTIWEYEIPKFDGDLSTPNLYVPLSSDVAAMKVDVIMTSFASQAGKPWFKADNLQAMMRLRGIESRSGSGFAEAFHCRKLLFRESGAT
ncbi:MAG TPA: PIG-L deacetylase family protein [Burkholderiaceae bacterium]|nr:PIG-L deacetylase family protein [Burkholderiaceae bacterium]